MKRKSIAAMAMASLMTLSLTACSSSAPEAAPSSKVESPATAAPETDAAPERIHISWLGWYSDGDSDGEIVKLFNDKFNVDLEILTDDGMSVRLAAGEIPDLFHVGTSEFRKYVQDEILAPMPWEIVKQFAPNLYAGYQKEIDPYFIGQSEIGGVNYGLVVSDAETGSFRPLIVYRGDWIDKVGGKVPMTLDEFESLMYQFTKEDPDGNGKNDTWGFSTRMLNAVFGAYGYIPVQWAERDGKLVYGGIQPEMKQALEKLAKYYADGVLHPEFLFGTPEPHPHNKNDGENTGSDEYVSNKFVNGEIGVTAGDYLGWRPLEKEGQREGTNLIELKAGNPEAVESLIYGKPPTGPNGQKGLAFFAPAHTAFITCGAQVANEPEKMEKILQILDYAIGTVDGFIVSRYGVEGTHYNKDADGYPVSVGVYSDWVQIGQQGGAGVFNLGSWLPSINKSANETLVWGLSMPELKQDGYFDRMFVAPDAQATYGAEVRKIMDEAYTEIITGKQPVDYFDEFVSQWLSNGGETITQQLNAER